MDGFIGQDVSALVRTYGVPNRTMDLGGGRKVYEYTRGSTYRRPIEAQANGYGGVTYTGGETITRSCTVDFTVDKDNEVTDWTANGNNCVAR